VIAHILLVKSAPDMSGDDRTELEAWISRLETVPGVRNLTWGRDFSGRGKGYDYGVAMYFDSREALSAYGADGTHGQIVAAFERLGVERLVVDYETGISGSST
jgi:hypothetical protein